MPANPIPQQLPLTVINTAMNEVNMLSDIKMKTQAISTKTVNIKDDGFSAIRECILEAWQKVAPFWPLKNLIAVNPLQGLENLPFEQAIVQGAAYFQQPTLPTSYGRNQ